MRDWKLESLANGKEISAIPFRTEKEEYLWRYSTISEQNFRKITLHLTSNRNFRIFLPNGKHPNSPFLKKNEVHRLMSNAVYIHALLYYVKLRVNVA